MAFSITNKRLLEITLLNTSILFLYNNYISILSSQWLLFCTAEQGNKLQYTEKLKKPRLNYIYTWHHIYQFWERKWRVELLINARLQKKKKKKKRNLAQIAQEEIHVILTIYVNYQTCYSLYLHNTVYKLKKTFSVMWFQVLTSLNALPWLILYLSQVILPFWWLFVMWRNGSFKIN